MERKAKIIHYSCHSFTNRQTTLSYCEPNKHIIDINKNIFKLRYFIFCRLYKNLSLRL